MKVDVWHLKNVQTLKVTKKGIRVGVCVFVLVEEVSSGYRDGMETTCELMTMCQTDVDVC